MIELQHLLPRTPLDSFLVFSQPVSTILVGDLFDQIYTNSPKLCKERNIKADHAFRTGVWYYMPVHQNLEIKDH